MEDQPVLYIVIWKIFITKTRLNSDSINVPSPSSPKPKVRITEFCTKSKIESLDEVLARIATLDGIPFQLFCTSEDIRKGLVARGFRDISLTIRVPC